MALQIIWQSKSLSWILYAVKCNHVNIYPIKISDYSGSLCLAARGGDVTFETMEEFS